MIYPRDSEGENRALNEQIMRPPATPQGAPGNPGELAVTQGAALDAARILHQMEQDREEGLSLQKYYRKLMARKKLILTVMAAVVLAAVLQVFTTTPLYRSFATLEIDPDTPNLLPTEGNTDSSLSPKAREEFLATQARKLQTRILARRVIEDLHLAEAPAFTDPPNRGFFIDRSRALITFVRGLFQDRATEIDERVLIDRFANNLGVQVLRNTRLIEVSFTSTDPELAASVVNTVVEEFIQQNMESRYQATTQVADFLSQQLLDLKEAVEGSEEELIQYARENDIVNVNERETIDVQKLADITDEMTRVESELIELKAQYQAVQGATVDRFPLALKNGTIERLESELSQQRQELAGLSSNYGPQWPAVKELEQKIAELEGQIRQEKQRAISLARNNYEVAVDRYRRLAEAGESQRQVVDQLNNDSIRYNILQRDVESNKELYEGLLQRLKEAGVSAGLNWSNIHMADLADVPRRPAYPRRTLALVVSLFMGLFLGVGSALLADAMDDTFTNSEEVAQTLRLPALGIIPMLEGTATEQESGAEAKSADKPTPVIAYDHVQNYQDPSWEAYRSLRTSILLSHSGQPPQTILVTSALPGEGKSTTVANTAIVLAQTGARTLILDLDMRRPTMANLFGVSSQEGMSTFLSGNSDLSSLVRETGFPNLYLVSAGPPAPNPAELVGAQRMRQGIQLLLEYFDYILIDSPPCLEITDALVISTYVDGLLLVVRAGKTPKELVRKASDRLLRIGGKILGVLVNAVDVRRSEYGYYHSYYRSYYGKTSDSRVRKSA